MFNKVFVEKELKNSEVLNNILKKLPGKHTPREISSISEYFGVVKKPYLQKRDNLNLFIGNKKGKLLREAPDAYGQSGAPHYYFIHAYNCIYECNYCYLQGHFNSPDIVIYLNHLEITEEIVKKANEFIDSTPWFHAGEFSDSLALSHITGELPLYFETFKKIPHAFLEFRTKSANIAEIVKFDPLPNVITSFSMSPADKIKQNDLKTPSLNHRIKAVKKLQDLGHPVALHFDPIIMDEDTINKYLQLLNTLKEEINLTEIEYISLGVVRFTKDVYNQVKMNYPKSEYFGSELTKSFDGKIRYPKPMRLWLLNNIERLCVEAGVDKSKIYKCMEE